MGSTSHGLSGPPGRNSSKFDSAPLSCQFFHLRQPASWIGSSVSTGARKPRIFLTKESASASLLISRRSSMLSHQPLGFSLRGALQKNMMSGIRDYCQAAVSPLSKPSRKIGVAISTTPLTKVKSSSSMTSKPPCCEVNSLAPTRTVFGVAVNSKREIPGLATTGSTTTPQK